MTDLIWCLVDEYGDGIPVAGPFASYAEAASFDPEDERFEPRQVTRGTWATS